MTKAKTEAWTHTAMGEFGEVSRSQDSTAGMPRTFLEGLTGTGREPGWDGHWSSLDSCPSVLIMLLGHSVTMGVAAELSHGHRDLEAPGRSCSPCQEWCLEPGCAQHQQAVLWAPPDHSTWALQQGTPAIHTVDSTVSLPADPSVMSLYPDSGGTSHVNSHATTMGPGWPCGLVLARERLREVC
jgi:hypothetical protein